ncbi:MAG: AhpC/TSA family protein [Bacteroidales bacterium]|nr:AhpC/TSA family protein [Bacteroidales bacterium]
MTKLLLLIALLTSMVQMQTVAQLPEKAEDISPLLYGEKIPEGLLKAPNGEKHQISGIIEKKPTVLLVYRGGWCPYCNAHLAEIQEAESEILSLGYQLIAVSPDSPENLQATDEKHRLNYSLYSDANGDFSKAMGLAFQPPERYQEMLEDRSNGKNEGFLPVPAVFVVDTSGTILFEYINPDYSTRISAGLLLAVLNELKN